MKSFFKHSFASQCQSGIAAYRPLCGCAAFALTLVGLLPTAALVAQSPAPAPAVTAVPTPPADARAETVISSDELDMVGGDEANHFYFRGNVKVQATNMIATADELEVISARQSVKGADDAAATTKPATDDAAPNIGSIREIIMRGNVVITQEGRRATAGIAYLYPQEGRVVLADNPLVTDAQGTLSGWRMELYRGERKVRILSNPDEKQRTRVTLPALQDLGYSELGSPEAANTETTADGAATAPADAAKPTDAASAQPAKADAPATQAQPADAAPKKDEAAEPASRSRRGSGWNPVGTR